eukprot:11202901-Lingulodinium_polyedra.AAC.1
MLVGLAKVASTRHFVPIVADLWEGRLCPADEGDRRILLALRALVSVYESHDSDQYRLAATQIR